MARNTKRNTLDPKLPNRMLGKLAAKHDPRTLRVSNYLPANLPPAQAETSWVVKVPWWPMMLNDSIGDCTIAAAGHMIQQWSFFSTPPGIIPSDRDVLTAYEKVGGYVPGQPWTDNGCYMLDVLKHWRKTGVGGHKIAAFMAVDPRNEAELFQAIQLFGNLYAGLWLPLSARTQTAWTVPEGGTCTPDGQPGSWGGHCVPFMAASPMSITCVTWGDRLKMSHNFLKLYCDELYAVVSSDWVTSQTSLSPSGFDMNALLADLAELR